MLDGLLKIKYYAMTIIAVFCLYIWSSYAGARIFGDDNENKTGKPTYTTSGGGHGGGHIIFFHK